MTDCVMIVTSPDYVYIFSADHRSAIVDVSVKGRGSVAQLRDSSAKEPRPKAYTRV